MKKVKKLLKVIGIIIVIIVIVLIIYIFIVRRIIAKKCVKNTFTSFTTGDYTEDFYYLDIDGDIQKYLKVGLMGNVILQNSSFKPVDYDLDWNSPIAKVTVEVSYPDIYEIYNKKFSNSTDLIPSEKIQEEIITSLKEKDYKVVTDKIELNIVQYKMKWYLLENEEFMNVYSGGMYKQYKEIITNTFGKEGE